MLSAVSIAANLVLLPLIFIDVGAGQYGLWLLLSGLATYLYQADLGMGTAVVHFVAKYRTEASDVQRELLSTGVTWMTLAGFAALPVYLVVGNVLTSLRGPSAHVTHGDARSIFWLGAVLVGCLGLRAFPSALQGYGAVVFQRASQSIAVVVRVGGTVYACAVLRSLVAVAAVETAALLLPPLLCAVALKRRGQFHVSIRAVRRARLREMTHYAVRAFVLGAMAIILMQADALIVGIVVSAAAVSYYSVASRIYSAVLQAIGWTTDPLLSLLSRLYVADAVRGRRMVTALLFATLWFATWACGTVILAAEGLVPIWLGGHVPEQTVTACIVILMVGLIVSATHEAAIPAADATGEPGAFAPLYVAWALANLVVSIGLGLAIGIEGVALGTALPLIVLEPLFVRRIAERLGVGWREWRRLCLMPVLAIGGTALAISGGVLAVASELLPSGYAWLACGAVFAAAYGAATWVHRRALPLESLRVALTARL